MQWHFELYQQKKQPDLIQMEKKAANTFRFMELMLFLKFFPRLKAVRSQVPYYRMLRLRDRQL